MSVLDAWRREIRLRLPRGFLRRDQGESLFVSDYPRFGLSVSWAGTGFTADVRGGLAFLDASPETYRALLSALPPRAAVPADDTLFLWSLARRLENGGAPFSPQAVPLIRSALKLLDAGSTESLYRLLAPAAAEAQRRGAPLPAALGRLILYEMSGHIPENKEEFPC